MVLVMPSVWNGCCPSSYPLKSNSTVPINDCPLRSVGTACSIVVVLIGIRISHADREFQSHASAHNFQNTTPAIMTSQLKHHHHHHHHSSSSSSSPWKELSKEVNLLGPQIHPPVPNPAPLGLIAFGLTTALLQVKHTRIEGTGNEVDAIVLGFAMFFGGLLQVIAGLSEIKRNNIFGYTAFLLYGGFWLSVGTVEIVSILGGVDAPLVSPKASQAMLFLCGLYTVVLWICTFAMNKTICLLFFLLAATFFLLMGGVENDTVDRVAGYTGIATAATAYWLAAAELVNDVFGQGKRTIIPLGAWKRRNRAAPVSNVEHGHFHLPGKVRGASIMRDSLYGTDSKETDEEIERVAQEKMDLETVELDDVL